MVVALSAGAAAKYVVTTGLARWEQGHGIGYEWKYVLTMVLGPSPGQDPPPRYAIKLPPLHPADFLAPLGGNN